MDINVYETYSQFEKNEPASTAVAEINDDGEYFYLKIQDDALSPRYDKDTLQLFKKQTKAKSGDVVLAFCQGEYKTRIMDYDKDSLWLMAYNHSYPMESFAGFSLNRVRVKGILVKE